MSLFDKMFKKGKFEEAMDSAFEKIEENRRLDHHCAKCGKELELTD